MNPHFTHVVLRTTDVDGARAFYGELFDLAQLDIVPLHEQAIRNGAPPHWLGFVGPVDVERSVAAFVSRGGARLGPTVTRNGAKFAVLRDPGGAVLAFTDRAAEVRGPEMLWHHLDASDVDDALATYRDVLGWRATEERELDGVGVMQEFAFEHDSVGSMHAVASRGVHPQWLHHFRVPSTDRALALLRAHSCRIFDERTVPGGDRIVIADDVQGAAVVFRERAR